MSFKRRHFLLLSSCVSALMPLTAQANPEGGVVAAGAATISSAGNTLTISQSTDRAIIDWRSFNIAPNETTRFVQPSSSSHTLNRVNDTSRSVIEGTIQANGNITIINPNGVFFSRGSVVDVAGLTATSADTSNADFMAGRVQHNVAGGSDAKIINEGSITVRDAGLAAFVAPGVENNGTITARLGKVKLAAGETFTLDMAGDGQMQVAVSADQLRTQVANSGAIIADGGQVHLTTAAARSMVDSLITNTGVIEAKSLGEHEGRVVLYGEGRNAVVGNIAANKGIKSGSSTVVHAGIINASGRNAGERGGSVEVLGDNIALTGTSVIDASGHTGLSGTTAGLDVHAVRSGSAGGDIKIGGDYLGQGTTAAAKRLFVAEGATITNDALHEGDAGRTIFWSDDKTQFAGNVSATSAGGDGGFVEVSGKNMLGFAGVVDLRSDSGTHGTLLLDPTDITISSAASTGTMTWDGTSFTDTTTTTSNLNVTTLTNQLALSNVIVSTASALGGAGDITVNNAISWNSTRSLTLNADNNIIINAAVSNSGTGGYTFQAGLDGAGNIDINANVGSWFSGGAMTLTATGGNILIGDADLLSVGAMTINSNVVYDGTAGTDRMFFSTSNSLTLNGTINGNILNSLSLQGNNVVDINQNISVNAGTVFIGPTVAGPSSSIGVAGGAGSLQLTAAELGRITAANLSIGAIAGLTVGAHTWAASNGNITLSTSNFFANPITFSGAQNFGAANVTVNANNIDINANLTGTGILRLDTGGGAMTMGGGAGTTIIDSVELDRIQNGFSEIRVGETNTTDVTLQAYSNWRDPLRISNNGNLTVSGAQSIAAGSDASFTFNQRGSNRLTTVNADINASGGTAGGITFTTPTNNTSTVNLGANLISGSGGITTDRAITLTGAAGTTRTINAGTGTLTINNNGTTTFGSITATDKQLTLIADNMTIGGAVTSTNNITVDVFSNGRTIGLAGAAGGLNLDNIELDFIDGFRLIVGRFGVTQAGSINIDARTWNGLNHLDLFNFQSGLYINGNQDFSAIGGFGQIGFTAPNYFISGNLTGASTHRLSINGTNTTLTAGGAAGTTLLDSTELDRIQDGWSRIQLQSTYTDVVLSEYTNWRDNIRLVSDNGRSFTISGAQRAASGSDATFSADISSILNINADVDFSASTNGNISFIGRSTGTTNLGANLISGVGGITIDRAITLTGAAGTTRTINAGTGTLAINNNGTTTFGSIAATDKNLQLRSDTINIGGNITGNASSLIQLYAHSLSRSVGLAGGAGDFNVDVSELNRISGFGSFELGPITNTGLSTTTINAYDWSGKFANSINIARDGGGPTNINGAQTFTSSNVSLWGDFNIAAAISNIGGQLFFGRSLSNVTVGGSNASSWLNSTELDFIADGSTQLTFASGNMTMEAYNNWRDPMRVQGGHNVTLTISGAQTAAAGSNASITLGNTGGYQYFSGMDINANVDFSGSTTGGITIVGRPNTVFAAGTANLGANLISGSGGITIDRAVTLTGAAGTTRTINANTGTLTINNNGTTTTGSITGTDKNLEIIANALSLNPVNLTATTGGILLSPFTTGWTIGVGDGGTENMIYSTALINTLKTNFAHYTFGRSTTGNITNRTATWDDNVTFLSSGNYTGTTAITADDGVTINVGNNITLDHAITSTNGPITLTAGGDGSGNIDINNGANIDAGLGALTLTATGGQINRGNIPSSGFRFLAGTGVTINSPFVFTDYAGWNQGTNLINARTGTLTINGALSFANVHSGFHELSLQGDDFAINNTISWPQIGQGLNVPISFATFSAGRQLSLAGATGGAELSTAELNLITQHNGLSQHFGRFATAYNTYTDQSGDVVVGARNWNPSLNGQSASFYSSGMITVNGAQTFGSGSFYGDVDINAAINSNQSGAGVRFFGKTGLLLTAGGAAGTTMIDSEELDFLAANIAYVTFDTTRASGLNLAAYSGWKQGYVDMYGAGKTHTISGAQSKVAGANTRFALGTGWGTGTPNNATYIVNADIDMSGTGSGNILLSQGPTVTTQLNANLISGANGITIEHAVTLGGAAGTTRTINAGTGTLTINNNGTTTFGSITATDKNLTVIADSVALTGGITSTSGNLHLRPFTNARTVGLGTGVGDFNLSNAELALLNAGSGVLTLGSTTGTGAYNINTNHVFDEHVVFDTDSGTMTLAGDLSSNARNITFATGADNFRISGNRSITATTSGNVSFGGINGAVGAENLTVSALGGAITIANAIGNVNALGTVNLQSLGAMALNAVNAASLFARTHSATADITLNNILTLSGAGTALELVAGDDIINNHGAGVFNLTGSGRFLTWSDDPLEDTGEEHFSAATTKRYNRNYGVDTPEATGNIRNYSVAPTLTITPTGTQYVYGDAATVSGAYTISGWHMVEDQAAHLMGGTASFITSYVQGNNAGTTYTTSNSGSTLSSNLNYGITYATSPTLTVNKADLRVKAVDVAFNQGGNPVVNFLYESTDFRMGENASTAGIVGAPSLITPLNTLAVGTHSMALNLAGVSSVNYNFLELMPRGIATVNLGIPTIDALNLPASVRRILTDASILSTDSLHNGQMSGTTSGSNNGAGTNAGRKKDINDNAGSPGVNTVIYDAQTGEEVTILLESIRIHPIVMKAFGLTYNKPKDI